MNAFDAALSALMNDGDPRPLRAHYALAAQLDSLSSRMTGLIRQLEVITREGVCADCGQTAVVHPWMGRFEHVCEHCDESRRADDSPISGCSPACGYCGRCV